jgi:hypothetical protein
LVDYVWKIAGFTECSQTCGGGNVLLFIRTTLLTCDKGIFQTYDRSSMPNASFSCWTINS